MSINIPLNTPEKFSAFPYQPPYSIQIDLMRHLYAAIENRSLAIVESPTGTGKTLSLLTSTLTWLQEDKDRVNKASLESLRISLNSEDDPEWVISQTFDRLKKEIEDRNCAFEEHLADIRRREQALRMGNARVTKKPRTSAPEEDTHEGSYDDIFLPDSGEARKHENIPPHWSILQSDVLEPTSVLSPTKIYYASRTHSQLSQVVRELLKLKPIHGETSVTEGGDSGQSKSQATTQVPRSVSLASRNHLCINEHLRSKTGDLDEGCRNLLTGRPEDRCPYLPSAGEDNRMLELRDRILASPKDIEDLVLTGRSLKLCPYFGSRSTIAAAELVTLPYNLLLHKRSRQTLGIELKDQIVVIDEAHNLTETLLQLHTVELSTSTLSIALTQLSEYLNRFRTRLNTNHALHLKRLVLFLKAMSEYADSQSSIIRESVNNHEEVMSVSAFVDNVGSKVNGINFLELHSYLTTSKLARKVSGYAEQKVGNHKDDLVNGSVLIPLHAVEAFIASLTNDVKDGIITFSVDKALQSEVRIKYQHLNPATHFDDIIRDARCVILAGGTMSPISDLAMQLYPKTPEDHVSAFSCGHVIPPSNLQCIVVGKGPRGKDLQFKFKDRRDQGLIDELGQCLFNFVNVSPRGMVVFFPSYPFLEMIKETWSSIGLLDRIKKKKKIFYEPHESADVDNVLRDYSLACDQVSSVKGALLFAVVGAKLSEGLNFADDLARAVVVIGIPYPNLASPELRERMKYISNQDTKRGRDAGRELYENLAMKAVNQSIGRAIRHRNDWSSLILIDSRYSSQKVQDKLPAWIRQSVIVPQSFGQTIKALSEFYKTKG